MYFFDELLEITDVVKDITGESILSTVKDDFPYFQQVVNIVKTVVSNPEPSTVIKLLSDDQDLSDLGKVLDGASLLSSVLSPGALLMKLSQQLEKKQEGDDDQSSNDLKDSIDVLAVFQKAHDHGMTHRAGTKQQSQEDQDQEDQDQEDQDQEDLEDQTVPRSKVNIYENLMKSELGGLVREHLQKLEQKEYEEKYKKASPEKKIEMLEKKKKKAESENSWENQMLKCLNLLERVYSKSVMGKHTNMDFLQTMDVIKDTVTSTREQEFQLGQQIEDLKKSQKLKQKIHRMKMKVKEMESMLKDFTDKLRIPHEYLISASERLSMEEEPLKSCLPKLVTDKLKSSPPPHWLYDHTKEEEMKKLHEAVKTVQTQTVSAAMLNPCGIELKELSLSEKNAIDDQSKDFLSQAFDQDLKSDPEFLQGDIQLPKSVTDRAFAKFKWNILELLDQIDDKVSIYQLSASVKIIKISLHYIPVG